MAYVEGDFPIQVGGNSGNSNEGFGGGWWGIIALVVVAAIFGRGNWGWGGNSGNGGGVTQADLCTALNFNNTDSAVRSLQSGLCDGFYAVNTGLLNGFAGVQNTLCQGFGGVNNAISTQGYQNQLATQSLSSQLASCCCSLEAAVKDVACQAATNTGAIISAGQANTQRIIDYLCSEKISALQAENATLTAQLSQNAQTRTIIDTLLPVARPAYITCSPYQSAFGYPYATSGYGCNSGCGCNGAF